MNFPIFTIFMLFIIWFTLTRTRLVKRDTEAKKIFWNKEEKANATRRRDIENLPYIQFPLELLSLEIASDDQVLADCKEQLTSLSRQRILNLTGITNTELKLTYGAPNLTQLTQYDLNFTSLVHTLNKCSHRLYELGYCSEASALLEFAIHAGSDVKGSYLLLAQIYQETGALEKISSLTEYAMQLNSMMKAPILKLLSQYE